MPREEDGYVFRPGDLVWFQDENGTWFQAHVEEVDSSRCTMVVMGSGDVVTEPTKYVVPANPEHESSVLNLSELSHITEPCLIHQLKQVSDSGSQQCLAGGTLCYLNTLGSKNPAAEDALKTFINRILLNGRIQQQHQSIRLLGAGNGGRTRAWRSLIDAVLPATASADLQLAVRHCLTVLQAFGNASTEQSADSCRYCSQISFKMTRDGQMYGAHIQLVLLERERAAAGASTKERLFHILHMLPAVTNARERHQLRLPDSPDEFKVLQKYSAWKPLKDRQDPVSPETWKHLKDAFQGLGINAVAALSVVAGILWLGNLQFDKVNGYAEIKGKETLSRVTALLGCREQDLTSVLITSVEGKARVVRLSVADAQTKRDLLCKELYHALVQWLVAEMNTAIAGDHGDHAYSISICNVYEWDDTKSNSAKLPALLHNYVNEALQTAFVSDTIRNLQDFFHNDGIKLHSVSYDHTCLEVMDALTSEPPANKFWGVLPLMHDYSNMVGVSDSSLCARLSTTFTGWEQLEFDRLNPDFFSIYHTCGRVDYTFNGMLAANKLPSALDIKTLLQACGNPVVAGCAAMIRTPSLPRTSSTASRPTALPTMASTFLKEIKSLLNDSADQTNHYVLCLNTNTTPTAQRASWTLLKSQLRRFNLRRLVQVTKAGHPYYLPFQKVLDLFTPLLPDPSAARRLLELRPAQAAPQVLQLLGVQASELFCGNTHVFFKTQQAWDRVLNLWLEHQATRQPDLAAAVSLTSVNSGLESDLYNAALLSSGALSGNTAMYVMHGSSSEAGELADKPAGNGWDVDSDLEQEVNEAVEDLVSLRVDRQFQGSLRSRISGASVASSSIRSDIMMPTEFDPSNGPPQLPPYYDQGPITPQAFDSMHSIHSMHSEQSSHYMTPRQMSFAASHSSQELSPTPLAAAPLAAMPVDNVADRLAVCATLSPSQVTNVPSVPPSLARTSYSALAGMSPGAAASSAVSSTATPGAGIAKSSITSPVSGLVGAGVATAGIAVLGGGSTSQGQRADVHTQPTDLNAVDRRTADGMGIAYRSIEQPSVQTGMKPYNAVDSKDYRSVDSLRFPTGDDVSLASFQWPMKPAGKVGSSPLLGDRSSHDQVLFNSAPLASVESQGQDSLPAYVQTSSSSQSEMVDRQAPRQPLLRTLTASTVSSLGSDTMESQNLDTTTTTAMQSRPLTDAFPTRDLHTTSRDLHTTSSDLHTTSKGTTASRDSASGAESSLARSLNDTPPMEGNLNMREPGLVGNQPPVSHAGQSVISPILVPYHVSVSLSSGDSSPFPQDAAPGLVPRTPRTPRSPGVIVMSEFGPEYLSMSGHMELPPSSSYDPLSTQQSSIAYDMLTSSSQDAQRSAPQTANDLTVLPGGGSNSLPIPSNTPFANYIPSTPSAPVDPEALRYRTLDDMPPYRRPQQKDSTHTSQSTNPAAFERPPHLPPPTAQQSYPNLSRPSPESTTITSSKPSKLPHDFPPPSAPRSLPITATTPQSPNPEIPSAASMPPPSPWGHADLAARVIQDVHNSTNINTNKLTPITEPHHRIPTPHDVLMFTQSSYPEITPADSDPVPRSKTHKSAPPNNSSTNDLDPTWLRLDMPSVNDYSPDAVVIVPPPASQAHKTHHPHIPPAAPINPRQTSDADEAGNIEPDRPPTPRQQPPSAPKPDRTPTPHQQPPSAPSTRQGSHHPVTQPSNATNIDDVIVGGQGENRAAPKPESSTSNPVKASGPGADGKVMGPVREVPPLAPGVSGGFVTQLRPLPEAHKLGQRAKWGKHPSPLKFTTELHAELLQTVSVVDDDIKFLQQVKDGSVGPVAVQLDLNAEVADLAAKFERWKAQFDQNLQTARKYIKQSKGVHGKDDVSLATQELKQVQQSFESWKSRTKGEMQRLQGLQVGRSGAVRFLPSSVKGLLTR